VQEVKAHKSQHPQGGAYTLSPPPPHVLVHTATLRYITSDINVVQYVNLHVCKSIDKICSGVVILKMHGSNIQLHCVTCHNYQTRVGMNVIYL